MTKKKDDTRGVMRAGAAKMGAMLDAEERLPVAELNQLVARLAAAPDQASGDALRQQILEGFYGPDMTQPSRSRRRVLG